MSSTCDLSRYHVIVGYGIGQNYEQVKGRLDDRIRFHYLADKKWEHEDIQEYDGIPVIRLKEADADICYIKICRDLRHIQRNRKFGLKIIEGK